MAPLKPTQTVQLFVTCMVDAVRPEIGEATVAVLEAQGVKVEFPAAQTCCGQPAYNAGYRSEARAVAAHFLNVFDATSGPVVTPSGSCAAMVHHGFADLFGDDPVQLRRAQAVAARTRELSQFLVHDLKVTNVGASFNGRITYHPSCHQLRGLGEGTAPLALLEQVAGSELVPLAGAEECCGFGGLFSVKLPQVSGEMVARKTANIDATGAAVCVTCDAGCLMNIAGRLQREQKAVRCVHLAEVLAGSVQA